MGNYTKNGQETVKNEPKKKGKKTQKEEKKEKVGTARKGD
jgi:hypothetical protein